MTDLIKVFSRSIGGGFLFAAMFLCVCTKVPDYCGDGSKSFDTNNQFCFNGEACDKCGGKEYDPTAQACQDGAVVAKPTIPVIPPDTTPTVVIPPDTTPTVVVPPDTTPTVPNDRYALTTLISPVGGGSVTRAPDAPSYSAGTTVNVTAIPASNYKFTGWSGASTSQAANVAITMDAHKSLTANFYSVIWTKAASEIGWRVPFANGAVTNGNAKYAELITLNASDRVTVAGRADASMEPYDIQIIQNGFNYTPSAGGYKLVITGNVTGRVKFAAGVQLGGEPYTTYIAINENTDGVISSAGAFTKDIRMVNTKDYNATNANAVFYLNIGFSGNATMEIFSLEITKNN
jgi:uncharacterized repeat protein (TIGR02543 family)